MHKLHFRALVNFFLQGISWGQHFYIWKLDIFVFIPVLLNIFNLEWSYLYIKNKFQKFVISLVCLSVWSDTCIQILRALTKALIRIIFIDFTLPLEGHKKSVPMLLLIYKCFYSVFTFLGECYRFRRDTRSVATHQSNYKNHVLIKSHVLINF